MCPSDWTLADPLPSTDAVVLGPVRHEKAFRPNLIVNSEPFTGSQAKLSTVTIAGHLVVMVDYHLIDVDVWDGPVPDGRRLEYVHRHNGGLLHCVQFTTVVDDRAVHLTFSCAEEQLASLDNDILACVDSSEVAR